MWKKIDSPDSVIQIESGDIISQHPDNPLLEFEIISNEDGYVSASHFKGKPRMKFFPANSLYYDRWWVKQ